MSIQVNKRGDYRRCLDVDDVYSFDVSLVSTTLHHERWRAFGRHIALLSGNLLQFQGQCLTNRGDVRRTKQLKQAIISLLL